MKLALVTYSDLHSYGSLSSSEDSVLVDYLTSKGLDLTVEVWNDPAVNWQQYEVAILKSPWDYFNRIEEFMAWLDKIEGLGVRLLNPIDIVRWNTDKHYLLEIEKAGLPVVPSALLKRGTEINLEDLYTRFSTDKLIVKPTVSGGAKNTFIVTKEQAAAELPKIQELTATEDFLAQPFMPQIQEEGEWSFLFFGGKYSHTLLKSAKSGDFRVQHFFGGTIHPQMAPAHLLSQAQKLVDKFAQGCLYARVDGIVVGEELQLMELELIEPFLFLHTNEHALKNYYQALKSMLPG
ncbi:hypothetical protein GU926_15975 [Nibribacter ruber]|uniref:ATP-grasp domain-containing protein n=1 Tax=Nibribacter ruber TaxID=2698458 RepID=A0A6P1P385_9BACT|nr:hypothetical protein [Nibribacter ruber]QHL88843.1 hypothetical protein GU926_15975 [Nibribacter ruber]